ncbi:MAG: lanthionine synthetase LanC family protein [Isosphaeraceae bacterium]
MNPSPRAIHDDLLAVVDAVEILSPDRYALLGEPRAIPGESPAEGGGPRLVSALTEDLYVRLYMRPSRLFAGPTVDMLARRDHIAKLSEANTGQGTWEPGWRFLRIDPDGQAVVAKDGIAFWAPTTVVQRPEDRPTPGEGCRVRVGKELRLAIAGYYVAIGDAEEDDEDGDGAAVPMVRYYWHLTAPASPRFLETATSLLNAAFIPFRIKVPVDPYGYHRADAGVLFLRRVDNPAVGPIIAAIHSAIAPGLRPGTPMFAKRLADGLAYAKSPPGSLSFGQRCCLLVAQGLCHAYLRGDVDREARGSAIAARFVEEGIDPRLPHLWTGDEADDVVLPAGPVNGPPNVPPVLTAGVIAATSSPMTPIEAASRIGEGLCQSAYWDDSAGLCNWIGRSGELAEPGGPIIPTSAVLGPDLYGGSAGVALFLARLHAMTGEPEFRRTALGAIHRSIRQLGRSPIPESPSPYSFFRGDLGVACAAWKVGVLTGHTGLQAEAVSILDRAAATVPASHPLDVLGGNAGAIPALLDLARTAGLDACLDRAVALGEALCRSATFRDGLSSWDPEAATGPGRAEAPLTGLSHGAAGIGLALFELHAATGRRDFLEAARGAFAYEDSLFDPDRKNWPDLRRRGRSSDIGQAPARFATAWCQGAPGIALTRLRAIELDPAGQEMYRAMARAALDSTLVEIDKKLENSGSDATLCHGLAGLMEVVLVAGRRLDDPAYLDRAREVGRALIDRHAADGNWPCGVPSGGPNPSMMLGTAGIGYGFLRLHAPEEVPSFLRIQI